MRKFYWIVIIVVALNSSAKAQIFSLLWDNNPGISDSRPSSLTDINGTLFFQSNDGVRGAEFWKSDGTATGTVMIKDINPGSGHSYSSNFIDVAGTVFFGADDGTHGYELWRTDGTAAGTIMIKDIYPGASNGRPSYFTNINGILFFTANDGVHGVELWKSDGTEAGTILIKDIYPGIISADSRSFAKKDGLLFLDASDGVHGKELWKSDGTEAGTILIKDIYPGPQGNNAWCLTNANGTVFFAAADVNHPNYSMMLWKSDGTAEGTVKVTDAPIPWGYGPEKFTHINETIYFISESSGAGFELWKSDGTAPGTNLVKDIIPGPGSSYPFSFTNVNGTLFFGANDEANGGLWKSDGTTLGTVKLKNIYPTLLTNINGLLFFTTTLSVPGSGIEREIWRSNGTATGTLMVQDIAGDAEPWGFKAAGSKLFVNVKDNIHGRELWVADLNVALPLTLLDFKGQLFGNNGLLTWKTSSEQNTSHFEIERSTDGRNFTKAGTVSASGNSSATKQYNFTERDITSLGASVVYYRLKMNDADGKFTYSKIIAINISSKDAVVMLYPNPVSESATLMISVVKKENISYSIIDQHGRTIQQKNIVVNEGSNTVTIDATALAAGVYTILLNGETVRNRLKFVKQ